MANESEIETDKKKESVRKKLKKEKKAKKKKKKAVKDEKSIEPSLDDKEGESTLKPEEIKISDQEVAETAMECEDENGEVLDSIEDRKLFLSRIPSHFDQTAIMRILQESFGEEAVEEISLIGIREDEPEKGRYEKVTEENEKDEKTHRGFAFVVMSTAVICKEAIEKGTVRGSQKENSKKKHTMYIRPLVREDDGETTSTREDGNNEVALYQKDLCYLWSKFRCPYGAECKFKHDGKGGCLEKKTDGKKKKCFSFRTTGKCKLGDDCPYSHDIKCTKVNVIKEAKEKDCINWKTKGKCRKGENCPYKHDEAVREAFLKKKEKKAASQSKKRERSENPQPLSVRVFGLNYETTEEDVREYFRHCGLIREITFPIFEDSGRSKGYCGVLFTSPKATEKACELDGQELHGRWLSVQPGKMYLKQWAEREKTRLEETKTEPEVGEFGQKVKRRKKHGFKDDVDVRIAE